MYKLPISKIFLFNFFIKFVNDNNLFTNNSKTKKQKQRAKILPKMY